MPGDPQAKFTADMMQVFGQVIEEHLPPNMAFFLIVSPYGAPGISNYIANAAREDGIALLRATADRLERNQDKRRFPGSPETGHPTAHIPAEVLRKVHAIIKVADRRRQTHAGNTGLRLTNSEVSEILELTAPYSPKE